MAEINSWSTSAASNTALFPNGMQVSQVNDNTRELQAILARWEHDLAGRLATAGTATAYTLTTYRTITGLSESLWVVCRAHVANTGAATLALNGLSAKLLTRQNGDDLQLGDIALHQKLVIFYNEARDTFECHGVGDASSETNVSEYTLATLPAATSKKLIVVTDAVGGRAVCSADGTNWRRVRDGEIVSAAVNESELPEYTVATLPAVSSKKLIVVTNESGGRVPAFADGTNWRRVTDRAIVS